LGVPSLEAGEALAEFADARPGGGVVHGPALERGVIAADRGFSGGDLCGDSAEFGLLVGGAGVVLGLGAFDDGGEDGFGGGVEVVQRVEDEVVDLVGGQPGRGAGVERL
jgi:hypothetical protein